MAIVRVVVIVTVRGREELLDMIVTDNSQNSNSNGDGHGSRTMKSRNRDPRGPGLKIMTPGRHHSSDSSEHIMEINDVEMQSYTSPNERYTSSNPNVNTEQTQLSSSGNGTTNSPTLIIQKNGEVHNDRPVRNARELDF
ncbi:hypothetical protein Daus18300_007593 [Diaporthe australafricana]|uniref:Integral membrane protein n=1 Tax=Diaporthe australafricana TaxID=127596 RepID=A0ABR3WM60_9PEZI